MLNSAIIAIQTRFPYRIVLHLLKLTLVIGTVELQNVIINPY